MRKLILTIDLDVQKRMRDIAKSRKINLSAFVSELFDRYEKNDSIINHDDFIEREIQDLIKDIASKNNSTVSDFIRELIQLSDKLVKIEDNILSQEEQKQLADIANKKRIPVSNFVKELVNKYNDKTVDTVVLKIPKELKSNPDELKKFVQVRCDGIVKALSSYRGNML